MGDAGMLSCCFSNLLVGQFNLGKSLNYTYVSVNVIIQVRTGKNPMSLTGMFKSCLFWVLSKLLCLKF